MANVSVFDMQGKEVGKMDLNDAVFGVEINEHLLHLAGACKVGGRDEVPAHPLEDLRNRQVFRQTAQDIVGNLFGILLFFFHGCPQL